MGGVINTSISISLPECCAYVFFVLSGFLAGFKGNIGMPTSRYYIKRAKKILPLYYGYIAVTLLVFVLLGMNGDVINADLLYYLFLVPQVPFCSSNLTGVVPLVHLWFIGTILLFYAVFPLFARINNKKKLTVSAIITISWALLKWGLYLIVGKDTFVYRFVGVTAFDCLFFGVWLGLLWKKQGIVIKIAENRIIAAIVWVLFLLSGVYGKYIPAPFRVEYMSVLAGLLILNQVSSKPMLSLENKVCRWLGSISYEIYVVQILVIMLISMLYTYAGWHWPAMMIYAVCTVAVVVIAAITKLCQRVCIK